MNFLSKAWSFLKLTRPLFLVGGVLLYLLGAFSAVAAGAHLNIWRLVSGQILVTSIQLMTHYSNEYFDLEGDRLNTRRTWFSGGSGVLSSGDITPQIAFHASIFFAILSLVALIFTSRQTPLVFFFGLLALVTAWSYSGPPLKLAGTGWGELSASLLVALIVPLVGYIMQSRGMISSLILITCIPLVLIHLAMLIAFQIPDQVADAQSGKRTLLIRVGTATAVRVHNFSLFAAVCVILGLSLARWPGTQFIWVVLPLAIWQSYWINRDLSTPTPHFKWLTTGALALFAITAALWVVGFLILWNKAG